MSDTKWHAYQDSPRAVGRPIAATSCIKHQAERGEPCFVTPLAICGQRFTDWARGHDATGSPTGP